MSSAYTNVVFSTRQPDLPTATKLNLLIDDLSAALDSIGGYYSNAWAWTTSLTDATAKNGVGINAATWAAATQVNVNNIASDGRDMTKSFQELFVSGNDLYLQDTSNSANNATYKITGGGTNNGTWWSFPVTYTSGAGSPPAKKNTATNLTIFAQGTGGGGTGTGDMTKAVYDTNNNGKVDTCDSVPWMSVTGKPTIGDMTKAVYDVNGNGIVDTADAIAWTAVTGKPTTFPPDSTAMLKSVYDTNANGVVDTADAIAWTAVTGKPTTFPPDSTAMLKSVYDTNANGVVDTADAIAWTAVTGKPTTFPPDSTAMLKSVYDTNANGVVDTCDSLPWGSVTGKPATIGDMLKSVYDTNANNIVDSAESANAAPWTGITGKPAAFPPGGHNPTHLDNGSDPIPVVTASRTGLAPTLNGNPATYLNGTGAYSAVSGSVNPGAWTSVTPGSGWTIPTQAQYRVEVNGAVSTVYFRGMLSCAYSALGTSAFTVPALAQPSMTRSTVLSGAQATGTPSDVASYIASMSSGGVCTVYPLAAGPFCWFDPSQTQQVYLDGLSYSL